MEQETELTTDDRHVPRDLPQEMHVHPTIMLSALQYVHEWAHMGRLRKDA